jgi:hypothetical protein
VAVPAQTKQQGTLDTIMTQKGGAFKGPELKRLHSAMARCFTGDFLPARLMDSQNFRLVLELLSRGNYQPIHRTKMTSLMDEEAEQCKAQASAFPVCVSVPS